MYRIAKKDQETPVLFSYKKMELECQYRCKSGKNDTFLFFTKLTFSPNMKKLLERG